MAAGRRLTVEHALDRLDADGASQVLPVLDNYLLHGPALRPNPTSNDVGDVFVLRARRRGEAALTLENNLHPSCSRVFVLISIRCLQTPRSGRPDGDPPVWIFLIFFSFINVYTTRPLNRVCWILRVHVHPPNQKLSRFGSSQNLIS